MGRELPWFDVIPLSRQTHQTVTVARMLFGRGPVNLVLRVAYFLWFIPYIAIVALLLVAVYPQAYPPIGDAMRNIISTAVGSL